MKLFRLSISALIMTVFVLALAFGSLRFPSPVMAGAVLLLTTAWLTYAILASVYRHRARRAFWVGFALFGWGYMALSAGFWWSDKGAGPELVTTVLLESLRPWVTRPVATQGASVASAAQSATLTSLFESRDPRTQAIEAALALPLSMPFDNPIPLGDGLKYIRAATQSPQMPNGIQIYLDPIGFREAGASEKSAVTIALDDARLRTSLDLILGQVGLGYRIQEGVLIVTSRRLSARQDHAYQQAGHCILAILFASVGGFAGRALAIGGERDRPAEGNALS